MRFEEVDIKGCFEVTLSPSVDERGWFSRVFCKDSFKPISKNIDFVQINHSFNNSTGTFRGMHYQEPPFAEDKLIRCISGKIIDIVLDLRADSKTFLQHVMIELSAEKRNMLFLPKGIAHGFQTLMDNTELIYHHTAFYKKEAEKGIRFNDPLINIKLPFSITNISEKDKSYQLLSSEFKGI